MLAYNSQLQTQFLEINRQYTTKHETYFIHNNFYLTLKRINTVHDSTLFIYD